DSDDEAPEVITSKATGRSAVDKPADDEALVPSRKAEMSAKVLKKRRAKHRKRAAAAAAAETMKAAVEAAVRRKDAGHSLPAAVPAELRPTASEIKEPARPAVVRSDRLDASVLEAFGAEADGKRKRSAEANSETKEAKRKSKKHKKRRNGLSRVVSGIRVVAAKPATSTSLLEALSQDVPDNVRRFKNQQHGGNRVERSVPLDAIARRHKQPAVSFFNDLCRFALLGVRHLGPVPQFLVADALAQCTAEQLEAIEQHNPHIIADNEPLWMAHAATKYQELRNLQLETANGAAPPVPSWRAAYWDMRQHDEIRAQQIMERVRSRMAALEHERNARKARVIPLSETRIRPKGTARQGTGKGASLVQHARMMTKAHVQMLQPASSSGHAQSLRAPPPASAPQPQRQPQSQLPIAAYTKHLSPAASPAQSPPYYSSASVSSCSPSHSAYSPPYVPHSAYSPPYVPDSGAGPSGGCSAGFNIFEDIMGVSVSAKHSSTVVIKDYPCQRTSPAAKRKRPESSTGSGGGPRIRTTSARAPDAQSACAARRDTHAGTYGESNTRSPAPPLKVRSEDLADPGAKDFFRMLSG
ncbi:hypothetical protein LPJ61_002965, partial [Coemansia biformis]